MSTISNILFAVAMLINVNIATHFNLAIYTICTVSIPALILTIIGKHKIKDLKKELNRYNKLYFLISSFTWCLMLISSVKAYELGSVSIVAPLFALTSIFNALVEFAVFKNKNKLVKKIIAALLLILGVILIKM
ncbi:MAG: hypothetical protein IJ475_01040 [Bacilli bacterium]|nr:hypothetical protein [Bacilli bacterium]